MKSAISKRSIELNGHKTSVSLEDEFWNGLRRIADLKKLALPDLLQTIDAARGPSNLSSAIRVFVLSHYRERAMAPAVGLAAGASVVSVPSPVLPGLSPK